MRRPSVRLPANLPPAALLLAAALLTACAPRSPLIVPAGSAVAPAAAPWTLPPGELATQRLLRASYDGPEGDGGFRLTLRLSGPERYRVEASDPLGRPLWTLDVAEGAGLWLDHREEAACRLAGRFDLAAAHLPSFPLSALPALLLGRVPATPATAVARESLPAGGAELAFRDADRRRWTVRLGAAGQVESWALWDGGEPAVWWRRGAPGGGPGSGQAVLSDRRRGSQLRWRQVVREPLAGEGPARALIPEGYRTVVCGTAGGGP